MSPDPKRFKNPNQCFHNWLVHRIHDRALRAALRTYATGVLVDIGCGEKPYAALTADLTTKHIGVDHGETHHGKANIAIFATAYETTLPDAMADTVLCTAVLEHLEKPALALLEMNRILKPGGHLILSVPLIWHVHEQPRDFYRYTSFGLSFLFQDAGFDVTAVKPLGGFIVTFVQELCYFLNIGTGSLIMRYPIRFAQFVLQRAAYLFHLWGMDSRYEFTWAYLAVARKPDA